ncbi:INCREASED PETAL GROWTH ANISOTROPY 1-like protein 2 isoform X2 [Tasmannia lanceolata]|uniref:INCREASED PETAL GROWTH ANISOTROPY 1-like protein 2 isoform X2 n=1 Tax=Tasmannia lanceolata TaxID=3420 RepID=UPI004063EACF
MKQDIASENKVGFSHPTTLARFRLSKSKDIPRSEGTNGFSPGLKARPKAVVQGPNNGQNVRRSLGLNKLKSGEDLEAQKGREMEETRPMGRPGNRAVEQHVRLRRRTDPNCKKIEDDSDGKKKELQQRLDVSEKMVKDLQSEIFVLKDQLEKLQNLNVELNSQNRQLVEDLSYAEARISALSNHGQRESVVEEVQSPEFRDVQKLIASKLEHFGVKKVTRQGRTVKTESASLGPVTQAAQIQPKDSMNAPPPPPPPPPTKAAPIQPKASMNAPPHPPPPPLPQYASSRVATVQKASALVDCYHSLTKRDGKKDTSGTGNSNNHVAINVHNSIVGEIQNRSSHLLAIKADVERKGEFIQFLIQKVRTAAYTDIEDVLTFVDWLDGELSSLADERAVLKHFDWPERKADAMREAAFEYRDLKRLQIEISSYEDDASITCEAALKKMTSLLDKSDRSIQRLIRLRALSVPSYKECKIPTEWMLDSGMISKIKLVCLKLAKMYMKRVSMELEAIRHSERELTQEALLLQCVRFAYRVHQFAGGLDSETMCVFEELRLRVPMMHGAGPRELLAGMASS